MTRTRDAKELRRGYTTGACAAAAAKAAASALLNQKNITNIEIELTADNRVSFDVSHCTFNSRQATCAVIKDAGDDPDSTNGAEIRADVYWQDAPGISIVGGEGVGKVTKPGLEVPVGLPAINPQPRRMIERAVREVITDRDVKVVISVTGGEELARKTLNSRLGITGGISILGTTGIVIPYSVDAYKASLSQALDIAIACGCREVVLTTGRRSEKYAQTKFPDLKEECFIQAGDFIGYTLGESAQRPVRKAIIWGMTGKISKLAAGSMYTNISDSKIDMDFLSAVAAACGAPVDTLPALKTAVTANHFRRLLPPGYSGRFCRELCRLATRKCRESAGGKLVIETIMSDYEGNILGSSDAGS